MDVRERKLMPHRRRQHQLFTLEQALEAGYTRPAVRRRLAAGTWLEVDARVYRVASGSRLDARQVLLARILAVGGIASGASAAALYGLVPFPREPAIVTSRTAAVRPRGTRLTDSLPDSDLTMVDGIRATRPARTIIELATIMPREAFEDVFDRAVVSKLVTMDRLEKRARELQAPRRPGCAVVLRLLDERHPELGRARNEMEAKVLRALDRLGAPRPRVNLPVILRGERRIIDFAWEAPKIALELDGFVPHSTRTVFDDDRVRRNLFTAEGWRMYHVTKAALQRSSREALALVLEALGVGLC